MGSDLGSGGGVNNSCARQALPKGQGAGSVAVSSNKLAGVFVVLFMALL